VSRWKRKLLAAVTLRVGLFFYRLARMTCGKMLEIVEGTDIGLGEVSNHHLRRVERRREYLLLTVLYAPEIDVFFDVVAAPDTLSQIKTFRNYLPELWWRLGYLGY